MTSYYVCSFNVHSKHSQGLRMIRYCIYSTSIEIEPMGLKQCSLKVQSEIKNGQMLYLHIHWNPTHATQTSNSQFAMATTELIRRPVQPVIFPAVLWFFKWYYWFKYDLGHKYKAPQVRPNRGSNSWPLDHDSTFHVTETPVLTTWPSVTSFHVTEMPALTTWPSVIWVRDG